jgi:hypothetical protein
VEGERLKAKGESLKLKDPRGKGCLNSEVGMRKWEKRKEGIEFGSGNAEVGKKERGY